MEADNKNGKAIVAENKEGVIEDTEQGIEEIKEGTSLDHKVSLAQPQQLQEMTFTETEQSRNTQNQFQNPREQQQPAQS